MNEYETLSKLLLKDSEKSLLMKMKHLLWLDVVIKLYKKIEQKQEVSHTQDVTEKSEDKLCTQLLQLQNI